MGAPLMYNQHGLGSRFSILHFQFSIQGAHPMTTALPSARVGRTALQVSRLGLGTAPLTGTNGSIPAAQSVETIRAALDAGVTLVDTAPLYGGGRSEQRLGTALAGVPRDRYVLS